MKTLAVLMIVYLISYVIFMFVLAGCSTVKEEVIKDGPLEEPKDADNPRWSKFPLPSATEDKE